MASATFVLSPEGVVRVHDAISCLSKFSETISWEISKTKLVLSALNSSKTASACISLDAIEFFQFFRFRAVAASHPNTPLDNVTLSYNILAKALLSVFKGRVSDIRDRDSSVESCEVSVGFGGHRTESRMVVKLICRHGVKKTYKLTYEAATTMRAVFDHRAVKNRWRISSSILRAFSEYFESRTSQLDFYYESGRFLVTSYTERIKNGSETLRQPLQTTIAIDRLDFDEFDVTEHIHIGISVKDFRAIITHAESLRAAITAEYSVPKQPLQLHYQDQGMSCEFTLVTIGEYRGGAVTPAAAPAPIQSNHTMPIRPESQNEHTTPSTNSMPPPIQPASRSFARDSTSQIAPRPSPPPPPASINQDSLFVQDDEEEEDRRWGEQDYSNEDELGWDQGDMEQSERGSRAIKHNGVISRDTGVDNEEAGIPPTQRLSQLHGMFD